MKKLVIESLQGAIECMQRDDRVDAADYIRKAVAIIAESYGPNDYSKLDIPYLPESGITELVAITGTGTGAYIRTWRGEVYYVGNCNYLDMTGNPRGVRSRKGLARILGVPLTRINKWRKAKREAELKERDADELKQLRIDANRLGYVLKPFASKAACQHCGATKDDPVHSTQCTQAKSPSYGVC